MPESVDPLDPIRQSIDRPSDAVRWACLLEATAPKAGNVYPGRSFDDLCYADFVTAAEIAADGFGRWNLRVSERMLQIVQETVARTQTNVNLGIVLLLGPLVAADEQLTGQEPIGRFGDESWGPVIAGVLSSWDGIDGDNIFRAIRSASAGGLGNVDSMDVNRSRGRLDLARAMTLAKDRDRIARQYATGFGDLIDAVVPVVRESIATCGDLLMGISRAHLRLLMAEPDSLIARKNAVEVAVGVQKRAQKVDLDDPDSISAFDDSLRGDGHHLNPGTTADLIAAALYLLLRTPHA